MLWANMRGRVGDGRLQSRLVVDGADARQRHAAGGEQVPGGDLDHVDAAQLADVLPAGDDRAHPRGAALHQTAPACAEISVPASGAPRQSTTAKAVTAMPASCRYASVNTRLSSPQAPTTQLNCCWFLSDVRWARAAGQEVFQQHGGAADQQAGLGSRPGRG